ncbi:unnamed protein product, partial [Oppiella nova]
MSVLVIRQLIRRSRHPLNAYANRKAITHTPRVRLSMNTNTTADDNSGRTGRGEADGAEQLTGGTGAGIAAVQVGTGGQQPVPKQWRPNPELMSLLTDMGISGVAAKKALYYTDNQSIELA